MRICLMVPPYRSDVPLIPSLGLYAVAAALENAGYDVLVSDTPFLIKLGTLTPDETIYRGCAELVKASGVPILGLSCNCATILPGLHIARLAKEAEPDLTIVLGGPMATTCHRSLVDEFPFVDVVVRGEGEITAVELLEHLESGTSLANVTGITYRDRMGSVRVNAPRPVVEQMNHLSFPAYHLMPSVEEILRANDGVEAMLPYEAGRGCTHNCSFCSVKSLWGRSVRYMSAERIVVDIERITSTYHPTAIYFTFDNFLAKSEAIREVCEALTKSPHRIAWHCRGRLDGADPAFLRLMREAGCVSLMYGVESANRQTWRRHGKGSPPEVPEEVIRASLEEGLAVTATFILGFPEESMEDFNATIQLALKTAAMGGVKSYFHLLTPLPETRIREMYSYPLVREVRSDLVSGIEFGPHQTLLHQDEVLINRYPDIFCSFYNIPHPSVALTDILGLANFYNHLKTYPRSFYLLLQELQCTPISLYRDFCSYLRTHAPGIQESFFSRPDTGNAELVKSYLVSKIEGPQLSLPYLPDVLQAEYLAYRAIRSPLDPVDRELMSSLPLDISDLCLAPCRNIYWTAVSYDVTKVFASLRSGYLPDRVPHGKLTCLVHKTSPSNVGTMVVSTDLWDFLRSLDGTKPIREAFDQKFGSCRSEQTARVVWSAVILWLVEQGFLQPKCDPVGT